MRRIILKTVLMTERNLRMQKDPSAFTDNAAERLLRKVQSTHSRFEHAGLPCALSSTEYEPADHRWITDDVVFGESHDQSRSYDFRFDSRPR